MIPPCLVDSEVDNKAKFCVRPNIETSRLDRISHSCLCRESIWTMMDHGLRLGVCVSFPYLETLIGLRAHQISLNAPWMVSNEDKQCSNKDGPPGQDYFW